MTDQEFKVVVSSGDLRPDSHGGAEFPHHWTEGGVVVESAFTGAHLMHLAIAGCVLNDVHREAERHDVPVSGVRVTAWGDFDRALWHSTGVSYSVDVTSSADPSVVEALLDEVDAVAEIPKAMRAGGSVARIVS